MEYIIKITQAILEGSLVTLKLFFTTLALSIPLGLLVALVRVSNKKVVKYITDAYIWVARGTPLLLQIFFVFYGLPSFGIVLDRFPAAAVAFVLNYAAYFAEIFRAGIQSIDKGQYESADVLGMTYSQTMRRIILPQMVKRVLPPVSNEVITLVKDTALVNSIGMVDLLRAANIAVIRDFNILPFGIAAVFYLLMTLVLTRIFGRLERKFSLHE